jgi:DNA repair protein SbcD/Mre11
MTKILIASDLHLNFNSPFSKTNVDGISSRLQEVLDSLLWAAEVGRTHEAKLFIILGDLFERAEKLPTKEGLAIVDTLKQVKAIYPNKFYALTGNHDQISSDSNILNLFNNILTVIDKPTLLDIDGGRLFFTPYIREPEELCKTVNEFKNYDCLGNKYLFGHFWDSTVMGVDSEAIDINKLNVKFFNRIFLGHYHVPTIDLNNLIIYSGTLLNHKFSETGPKGCWILETDTNEIEFIKNPHSPEFYSTDDTVLLNDPTVVEARAYYRVYCDATNVVDITKILALSKGYEILSKKDDDTETSSVSIESVEKKNSLTLKEFIFKNALLYTPDGVTTDEFLSRGKELLSDL